MQIENLPKKVGLQAQLREIGQVLFLLFVAFLVSRIPLPAGNHTASVLSASVMSAAGGPPIQSKISRTQTPQERCKNFDPVTSNILTQAQTLNGQVTPGISVKTLQSRKDVMLKLAKNNPRAFLCSVIDQSKKGTLSPLQNELIETPVNINTKIYVIHGDDFKSHKSTFSYQITQNGKTLDLYLDSEVPVLSGTIVKASGYQLDDIVVASSASDTFQIVAAPTTTPQTGNQKIMVLLVNYLDSPATPFSDEEIQNFILNGNVQKLYRQASNQKISFSADAYGWYTIPVRGSSLGEYYCQPFINPNPFAPPGVKSVRDIIQENNINVSNYQMIMVMTNFPCPTIDGFATIGSGSEPLIINGQSYSRPFTWFHSLPALTNTSAPPLSRFEYVIAHELGHNLGVFHAGSWFCGLGQDPLYGADCRHEEYGNSYDVMGNPIYTFDFNAAFKEFLGWVNPSNVLDITVPGRYILNHLGDSTGFQIAKVRQPGTSEYPFYLEYRKAVGFDIKLPASAQRGLFINWIPDDERSRLVAIYTRLLDATPNNDSFVGVTLNTGGAVFWDFKRGIQIGPVISADDNKIVFDVSFPDSSSARITSPVANSVISPQTTFSWSAGTGVSEYWLGIGTSLYSLGKDPWGDIYAQSTGTNTSVTVSGIPENGAVIYVRLWSLISGAWNYVDYQYTASTKSTPRLDLAKMTSPVANSVISPQTTFSWSAGTGVSEYWLGVGTTLDSLGKDPWGDIYAQSTGTDTSVTVSGIPQNGAPIYVRLWSLINGSWTFVDYQYTASQQVITPSPVPTLSLSTLSAQAGAPITVTFTQPNAPSVTDWIGLYTPSSNDNTAYISWQYTSSCTATAGATPRSKGTCTFTVATPGSYEFRLFSNDGYDKLATSKIFTITK
ncbi:MAG: hypothetical protein A2760_02515 [Candidatus Doudnabacteria bacterium RIFCSPHIGHO2_01_FULL_50_67]|uniref:Peptidase M11 gametolysin domain-containing protein n=1 Tax=Candidatus Doudnabacteria bacterium RIFCSPHIGHO2_12_FULL_48_16 TaxID=1817838 RepID=A0A1F5PLU4_9BACT|nr:MAG: hypothetical protein A3B77_01760 [Candidatus Doudnabacteria bacterium RIFCSPHIGHO2_02_FULL_49_24]OGE89464.1 MAG: hypothetical protein A2760_02515 [Candidatus Doudnabacteria bacterium RIFCSPHIGHO2_01_FULL_50_67]OGE90859.1 MAG: hypothetical protein A3E29_01675 [Candidatus Doudnabacteria bacterium RIFCSPHIGHO2_12_FULL_48_16]OGE97570.1 MAG: hypothetical protein A2990_02535 [Candidatus Doudnabacteria bacterium RIFCSPLOWO2_01_FULL_49_40]